LTSATLDFQPDHHKEYGHQGIALSSAQRTGLLFCISECFINLPEGSESATMIAAAEAIISTIMPAAR
jgi:hypothetical protein